jgi:hypothetical protein
MRPDPKTKPPVLRLGNRRLFYVYLVLCRVYV